MRPRIAGHEPFHVVGMRLRFRPGRVEGIPLLWDRFLPRVGEIRDPIPGVHYGVCVEDPSPSEEGPGFLYTACTGVASPGPVPAGMVGFEVPGGTFAVFVHRGPIGEFGGTVQAIWREWIPASGLRPTGAPDFELYDERYRAGGPDSEVEVWVPVAPPG